VTICPACGLGVRCVVKRFCIECGTWERGACSGVETCCVMNHEVVCMFDKAPQKRTASSKLFQKLSRTITNFVTASARRRCRRGQWCSMGCPSPWRSSKCGPRCNLLFRGSNVSLPGTSLSLSFTSSADARSHALYMLVQSVAGAPTSDSACIHVGSLPIF